MEPAQANRRLRGALAMCIFLLALQSCRCATQGVFAPSYLHVATDKPGCLRAQTDSRVELTCTVRGPSLDRSTVRVGWYASPPGSTLGGGGGEGCCAEERLTATYDRVEFRVVTSTGPSEINATMVIPRFAPSAASLYFCVVKRLNYPRFKSQPTEIAMDTGPSKDWLAQCSDAAPLCSGSAVLFPRFSPEGVCTQGGDSLRYPPTITDINLCQYYYSMNSRTWSASFSLQWDKRGPRLDDNHIWEYRVLEADHPQHYNLLKQTGEEFLNTSSPSWVKAYLPRESSELKWAPVRKDSYVVVQVMRTTPKNLLLGSDTDYKLYFTSAPLFIGKHVPAKIIAANTITHEEDGQVEIWCNVIGNPTPAVTFIEYFGDTSGHRSPSTQANSEQPLYRHSVPRKNSTYICHAYNSFIDKGWGRLTTAEYVAFDLSTST